MSLPVPCEVFRNAMVRAKKRGQQLRSLAALSGPQVWFLSIHMAAHKDPEL